MSIEIRKLNILNESPPNESQNDLLNTQVYSPPTSTSSKEDNPRKDQNKSNDLLKEVFPQRKRRDFIPNELKDEHYWERRRKNNLAAKRSREKRRLNDMVLETKLLEMTNLNNILKLKLELCMKKFEVSEEELEKLFEENRHLLVVQETLDTSEYNLNEDSFDNENIKQKKSVCSSSSHLSSSSSIGEDETDDYGDLDHYDEKNECENISPRDESPPSKRKNLENEVLSEMKNQYPLLYNQLSKSPIETQKNGILTRILTSSLPEKKSMANDDLLDRLSYLNQEQTEKKERNPQTGQSVDQLIEKYKNLINKSQLNLKSSLKLKRPAEVVLNKNKKSILIN